MPNLRINEIYGPVHQGEGPATGMRCGFLRLANCNLDCGKGEDATWFCDTPYTWDWNRFDRKTEVHNEMLTNVVDEINKLNVPLLIISGGEPLLQRTALEQLLPILPESLEIDIETNGTRMPLGIDRIGRYVISLKLQNSGVLLAMRRVPAAIEALKATNKHYWKFVVYEPDDFKEIDQIVKDFELDNVWIMTAGTEAMEILRVARLIEPYVLDRGYNFTLRQHVLLFDDKRRV